MNKNTPLLLMFCLFGIIMAVNGESYSDTLSNIHPTATKEPISWTHHLPSNCTNITSLTIKIKAYDVDKNNYIAVYLNGVLVGYLDGGHNNQWSITTITPDANTLKQISDISPTSISVYVASTSSDWVGVDTSELSITYIVDENVLNNIPDSSYNNTQEDVHPGATYNPITWIHDLPDNYTMITKMIFTIEAYDVDNANYIPVYANGVKLGYLSGFNDNKWAVDLFIITDKNKLMSITNNNTAKTVGMIVMSQRNDWVGIGNASLSIRYESGTNTHSTYIDSKEGISSTTPNTITWTHDLTNKDNITSIKFVIVAYDVDNANYIPVYANNVSLGYLVGGPSYNNRYSTTVFEVSGNDINTIIGDSTVINMRVEPTNSDWVAIHHSEMIVQYDGVIIPKGSKKSSSYIKTPTLLYAIIITIIIMSSIVYNRIKNKK